MTTTMGSRLQGKVALVTGGAQGMGVAHVRQLVSNGAKVVFGDILEQQGRQLEDELQGAARFIRQDVTSEADWARAVAEAESSYGPISILVNNAGVLDFGPLDEMSEARFRRVIDVNQVGVFLGMKAVVESMKKAGGGSIINISSTGGIAPILGMVAYVASKFAVRGMTKVASMDLAEYNIRVNSVHPGPIATAMTPGAPSKQAIKRSGTPDEVANMVVFLASDESSYCTGSEYVVDGGYLNVVGELLV